MVKRSGIVALAAAVLAVLPLLDGVAQPSPPNILLITIDTLRADRLGAYGHKRARTPVLDRLASEGARFADATAHAPLTYPSHVAILTGRYPASFGVKLNGMTPLPQEATTIAERLRTRGYRTGAVIGSVIIDRSSGLDQGFEHYDDRIPGGTGPMVALADLQRTAEAVTRAAVEWIAPRQSPWFLWAHYYDPHLPYSPPAYATRAAPSDPYDAEIAYVDEQIGVLLGRIDRSRTLVIVTSDHGEALGDHGEDDHGYFIYDATLRVPLIVAGPGVEPRVIAGQVRSVDIAPTIAAFAGATVTGTDGEDLRPLLNGSSRRDVPLSVAESWYPRMHFGWSELRSARVGEWKFIAAPKPELYDLRTDPGETKNIINDRPQVAARLAADLRKVAEGSRRTDRPPAAQPDAATIERLQALGYVGAFAPVTESNANVDPKDRLAEYKAQRMLFNQALGLLGRDRPAEAVPVLQKLVKANVRAFEAHLYLGNAYLAMDRYDAAIAEFDVTSQLNPALATPHFEAAKALSSKGQVEAAVERARQGLALEPQSFYGHYTLGVIYRRAERWHDAFASFSKAVALNGRDPRAHSGLAAAALRVQRFDEAERSFTFMIDAGYQVAPAHFNLGLLAERRGNREEARRHYTLALKADPSFKPARDALGKLK